MKTLLLCLIIAAIGMLPIWLQADGACETAQLKADIEAQLATLEEDPIGALGAIISLAVGGLTDCSEDRQVYSGDEGAQPVLGPLAIAEGLHILTMTTDGSARVEGVDLEGCGNDVDGLILNFSAGQGIRGASNLVEAEDDCKFYLELSRITAPWTLTIDKAPQP